MSDHGEVPAAGFGWSGAAAAEIFSPGVPGTVITDHVISMCLSFNFDT